MKKKTKDEIAVPVPTVDIQNDEFRGQGGSYVFDPVTGKRTRITGPNEQPATEQPEVEAVAHESE